MNEWLILTATWNQTRLLLWNLLLCISVCYSVYLESFFFFFFFCQENTLVIANNFFPTIQEMTLHMDITRPSISESDWLCSLQPKMDKLYTVSKNKTRSLLWLRSWTPYCKIQASIEVGKTTRPFMYDLNQIPYDYIVEVMNRFKGLDLVDRVPKNLWMEVFNTV